MHKAPRRNNLIPATLMSILLAANYAGCLQMLIWGSIWSISGLRDHIAVLGELRKFQLQLTANQFPHRRLARIDHDI